MSSCENLNPKLAPCGECEVMNLDSKPIRDVTDLKPIVEKVIKTLYGENVEDITIKYTKPYPSEAQIESWYLHVEFRKPEYSCSISLNIQASDGRVTQTNEIWRNR